ncbi:hypothetical protein EDD37DRAFT_642834 [Exophiala viscosa]|uniref:uncharacterized protein n=1 Tax=Exophiala viscosa TaxID=2486360 RepID=UPI00219AD0CE|nr:hypothetical protein EDD37DRAFT_642834 [Exophiala viscosa]
MDCLAYEIALKIVDEIRDDRTALVNLAKTCKHFYAMTEAHRFRKVHLRTKSDYLLLFRHLQSKDSLRNMVETLVIGPELEMPTPDFWLLRRTIRRFPRLKDLLFRYPEEMDADHFERLESYYATSRQAQSMTTNTLRSCTLVLFDEIDPHRPSRKIYQLVRLYDLPRLEELNTVGARLSELTIHLWKPARSSPLKILRLEDCHSDFIHLVYLRPLLSIPKALRTFSFSIDANSFYHDHPLPYVYEDVAEPFYDDVGEPFYMQNLLRVLGDYHGKSLTRLELKFNYTRILGSTCTEDTPRDLFKHLLAKFVELKHFELGMRIWEWSDYRPIELHGMELESGGHRTQIHLFLSTLPHTLESFKLRLIDGPGCPVTGMQYLCEKIIEWKAEQVDLKLFELEYVENRDPTTTACIMQRAQIEETGKALKKAGIQFRVYETVVEKAEARGMVHGQHLPTFVRVYDSYGNGAFVGQGTKMELMDDWYRNCGERLY